MKIFLTVISSLMALLAFSLYSCERTENPSRKLELHAESLYDGFWVPRYFPSDISSIREQHDIDTNEVWLRFTLGNQTYQPTVHGYAEVVNRASLLDGFREPFSSGWWVERDVLEDTKASFLYSGPCHATAGLEDGMRGFVLIHGKVVYWWCQYM